MSTSKPPTSLEELLTELFSEWRRSHAAPQTETDVSTRTEGSEKVVENGLPSSSKKLPCDCPPAVTVRNAAAQHLPARDANGRHPKLHGAVAVPNGAGQPSPRIRW